MRREKELPAGLDIDDYSTDRGKVSFLEQHVLTISCKSQRLRDKALQRGQRPRLQGKDSPR
jgi:hypothetical protein